MQCYFAFGYKGTAKGAANLLEHFTCQSPVQVSSSLGFGTEIHGLQYLQKMGKGRVQKETWQKTPVTSRLVQWEVRWEHKVIVSSQDSFGFADGYLIKTLLIPLQWNQPRKIQQLVSNHTKLISASSSHYRHIQCWDLIQSTWT